MALGKLLGLAFQSRRLTLGQLWRFLSLLPACPAWTRGPAAVGLSCLHSDCQFAARGMEGSWDWNCFTFPCWAVTGGSTAATGAADLSSKKNGRGTIWGTEISTVAPRWANPAGECGPQELSSVHSPHCGKSCKNGTVFCCGCSLFGVFRCISYWCKLQQTHLWVCLKGCLSSHLFSNTTF